jgi:hypothetical protein
MVGSEAGGDSPVRARTRWLLLVLLALAMLAVLARAGYLPRPFRPTIRMSLAQHDAQTMSPGQYVHWEFELPSRVCQLTGEVTGAHSPGDRFYAALMGDADFRRFAVNHAGNVFWDTTATAARLSTTLQGPGVFHLVVSNHFSATGTKTVSTTAEVECP